MRSGPELLLLAATLTHPLFVSLGNPAQTPAHEVNGILGRPVNFSINISSGKPVEEAQWSFQTETGSSLIIAEFKDGEMKRPNPKDRFGQRLEVINKTMVRIKELAVEDGGEYTVRVRWPRAIFDEETFVLNVFDPVPQPRIHLEQGPGSVHGCNVTLQCLASGKGRFNISWRLGNSLRDLERDSDWYQLSSNGSALYLFWQPGSLDSNFTCLVSNPAERKSVSSDICSICKCKSEEQPSKARFLWLLPVFLIPTFTILGFVIWRKRGKRSLSTAAALRPNHKLSEPPDSAVDHRRSPPEGDDEQELDQLSEQGPTAEPLTVYAVLQRPTQSFGQAT